MRTEFYFISRLRSFEDGNFRELSFLGFGDVWQDGYEGAMSFLDMGKALDYLVKLYGDGVLDLCDCEAVAISMYDMERDSDE